MREFLTKCDLTLKYKHIKINLMDYFPLLKRGIVRCIKSIQLIFYFYSILNNIDHDILGLEADHLLTQCFGNQKNITTLTGLIMSNCIINKNKTNIHDDFDVADVINEFDLLSEINSNISYNIQDYAYDNNEKEMIWPSNNLIHMLDYCSVNGKLIKILSANYDIKLLYHMRGNFYEKVEFSLRTHGSCPFLGYTLINSSTSLGIIEILKYYCSMKLWLIKLLLYDVDVTDIFNIINYNVKNEIVKMLTS
jgi:hypothetical protein